MIPSTSPYLYIYVYIYTYNDHYIFPIQIDIFVHGILQDFSPCQIFIPLYTGWGPKDSVQLPYKWLYGRQNCSYWELYGFINQQTYLGGPILYGNNGCDFFLHLNFI